MFVNNTLTHNGTNPQPGDDPLLQFFATLAADITYVVPTPANNCFSGNTYETIMSLTPPPPDQVESCD